MLVACSHCGKDTLQAFDELTNDSLEYLEIFFRCTSCGEEGRAVMGAPVELKWDNKPPEA